MEQEEAGLCVCHRKNKQAHSEYVAHCCMATTSMPDRQSVSSFQVLDHHYDVCFVYHLSVKRTASMWLTSTRTATSERGPGRDDRYVSKKF